MPYIKQYERGIFDEDVKKLASKIKSQLKNEDIRLLRPGYLNYCITKLLLEVYGRDSRYADYNEMVGMLECCKQELYRVQAAPYEDIKSKENGKV
jgi:hypothetical protein